MYITLENVFFIIGPTMRIISKDDSYLQESDHELLEPYDENNAFNIFTNNLKLRKKGSNKDQVPGAEAKPADKNKEKTAAECKFYSFES